MMGVEIGYDTECSFCTRWAERFKLWGYATRALEEDEVAEIQSMRVRFFIEDSADEYVEGDALIQLLISRWPYVRYLLRSRPARAVMRVGYRYVARTRHCRHCVPTDSSSRK